MNKISKNLSILWGNQTHKETISMKIYMRIRMRTKDKEKGNMKD